MQTGNTQQHTSEGPMAIYVPPSTSITSHIEGSALGACVLLLRIPDNVVSGSLSTSSKWDDGGGRRERETEGSRAASHTHSVNDRPHTVLYHCSNSAPA